MHLKFEEIIYIVKTIFKKNKRRKIYETKTKLK